MKHSKKMPVTHPFQAYVEKLRKGGKNTEKLQRIVEIAENCEKKAKLRKNFRYQFSPAAWVNAYILCF